jgi:hypothetical protein
LGGVRPTGGVQGTACLCTSSDRGEILKLAGTIYGGWWSTENSLIGIRFHEFRVLNSGVPNLGYFDLSGRWQGQELVLQNHDSWSHRFRSGLQIDPVAVTFRWVSNWNCTSDCAKVGNH